MRLEGCVYLFSSYISFFFGVIFVNADFFTKSQYNKKKCFVVDSRLLHQRNNSLSLVYKRCGSFSQKTNKNKNKNKKRTNVLASLKTE
jgi:hypothetical protein